MMEENLGQFADLTDRAPGVEENEDTGSFASYTAGLAFALLLTGMPASAVMEMQR
jgi:hypothetical protein